MANPSDTSRSIGPLHALREQLVALRIRAGGPSYREIATLTGRLKANVGRSHTTVSSVLTCSKLPKWASLEPIVIVLNGDVALFRSLWQAAAQSIQGSDYRKRADNAAGSISAPVAHSTVFGSKSIMARYASAERMYANGMDEAAQMEIQQALDTCRLDLSKLLIASGRYREAGERLAETIAAQYEMGIEELHPNSVEARRQGVELLIQQGNILAVSEVSADSFKASGTQSPEGALGIAETSHTLAWIYSCRGRADKAVAEMEAVVGDRSQLLGVEHRDTLRARHDLASMKWQRGDFEAAEADLRTILRLQIDRLGESHIDSLRTRHSLANALHARGCHAAAEQEFRTIVEIRSSRLGESHQDTLRAKNNLAVALFDQGRPQESLDELTEVLESQQLVMNHDSPDVLGVRNNLANLLCELGQHSRGAQEYRQVMSRQEVTLGKEHPQTLGTRQNIAIAMFYQGFVDESLRELYLVAENLGYVVGQDHPRTLSARHNLAKVLRAAGRLTEAKQQLEEVLRVRLQIMGEEHPATLATRRSLRQVAELDGPHAS